MPATIGTPRARMVSSSERTARCSSGWSRPRQSCRRICSSRLRCSSASTSGTRSPSGGLSAPRSTAPAASRSCPRGRRTASARHAGALSRRPRRPDHRRRRAGITGPSHIRQDEHRSGAATSQRNPGHCPGTRRRHHRGPSARGRPQSIQAGRFHHQLGDGRALSPARPRRAGIKLKDDGAIALPLADPSTTSFAIVQPPYEPAAVAAESDSRGGSP